MSANARALATRVLDSRLCGLVGVVGVVVAVGVMASRADAAAPSLGRWDGQAGGTQVVFTVEQNVHHRRFVVRPVFYCAGNFSYFETGPLNLNSPDAWPIPARGAFPGRSRAAPFRGRFGAQRGTFTVDTGGAAAGLCPVSGTRFTARWDAAAPIVRDGTWNVSLQAPQPSYIHVSFETLGQGSLIRSAWTLYGGPLCANFFAGPTLGLVVGADGSFATTVPGSSGPTFQVSGRFLSGSTATGTYTITGPDCSGQPTAWTATLATPSPAPRPAGRGTRIEPPPNTVNYVALGDSYSSGQSVLPYDRATNVSRDKCHRSKYAYSRQLKLPQFELRHSFFACSGATTANVTSAVQFPGEHVVQLGHTAALRAADLVTITIGGNDVRFDQVLAQCSRYHRLGHGLVTGGCSKPAQQRAILDRAKAVEPRLISTYAAIRAAVPATAAVIALDYPQLFPRHGLPRNCQPDAGLFTGGTQQFLRRAASQFRATIGDAARRAGVQFVDVMPIFAGHEICGRHGGWINHIQITAHGAGENSAHPNRAGQAAYARALADYIHASIAAHAPLTPSGLPADPPPQG